jgi:hypothetical protein
MDEHGLVSLGMVGGGLLKRDWSLPYGVTTSPTRLLRSLRQAASLADLVVLDLGETSRAAEYAEYMSISAAHALRRRAVEKADRLLGEVLASLSVDDWAVMVLTPNAREAELGEHFVGLTPVILRVPGAAPSLLASSSTRRPGIVANTDVAATVLEHFGLPPSPETVGRPMFSIPVRGNPVRQVQGDLARHEAAESVRRQVFRLVPIVTACALWLSALLLVLGPRSPGLTRSLARGGLILGMAAPVAMLLVSLQPLHAQAMMASIAIGSLAIALISSWVTGWRSGYVPAAVAVVGVLVYDLAAGQELLQWSPFSYSPAAGARFYGLGNEYAGVLLGAGLVSVGGLLSPRATCGWLERSVAALGLLAVAVLIGLPSFGANLGMGLASTCAVAVFGLFLWRERVGGREVGAALLIGSGLLGAAITIDLFVHGAEASHIGRWAAAVREQGWPVAAQVFARKLSMNWMLVRLSLWTDAAAAAVGVLLVSIVARPAGVKSALAERDWVSPSVIACAVGAVVAFIVNDSGVVAAALVLLYGAGSLAYLGLDLSTHRGE